MTERSNTMSTAEQLADELESLYSHIYHCEKAAAELRRLAAIEAAARKLVTAKGRYHTECNYKALEALIKGTS